MVLVFSFSSIFSSRTLNLTSDGSEKEVLPNSNSCHPGPGDGLLQILVAVLSMQEAVLSHAGISSASAVACTGELP